MNNLEHIPYPNLFVYPVKHIPLKRIFDICFSLCALIVGFPLFFLIGVLIACTSKGKVLFTHPRIGRGGKIFSCYKFRTMYADAEKRLQDLLESDLYAKKEWEDNFKLKKDPRVTPFGRFLRQSSLDELPQFWNVLKGDLSVVGPRPITEIEVKNKLGRHAAKFLRMRPGITGPWQVSGRSNTSYQNRIRMDIHYIRHQSFFWDLYLILKTIPAMLTTRGAY